MKLAIYKNVPLNFESVCNDGFEENSDYIRISEFVDIEFPMLSTNDVTVKEVTLLRQAKKTIQAETEIKLNEVDRKIGELLALPQPDQ